MRYDATLEPAYGRTNIIQSQSKGEYLMFKWKVAACVGIPIAILVGVLLAVHSSTSHELASAVQATTPNEPANKSNNTTPNAVKNNTISNATGQVTVTLLRSTSINATGANVDHPTGQQAVAGGSNSTQTGSTYNTESYGASNVMDDVQSISSGLNIAQIQQCHVHSDASHGDIDIDYHADPNGNVHVEGHIRNHQVHIAGENAIQQMSRWMNNSGLMGILQQILANPDSTVQVPFQHVQVQMTNGTHIDLQQNGQLHIDLHH